MRTQCCFAMVVGLLAADAMGQATVPAIAGLEGIVRGYREAGAATDLKELWPGSFREDQDRVRALMKLGTRAARMGPDEATLLDEGLSGELPKGEALAEMEEMLARRLPGGAELEEALALPHGKWYRGYDGGEHLMGAENDVRRLEQLLMLDARVAWAKGDVSRAEASIGRVLRLARNPGGDGGVTGYLQSWGCRLDLLERIHRDRFTPSAAGLRAISELLLDEGQRASEIRRMTEVERVHLLDGLRLLDRQEERGARFAKLWEEEMDRLRGLDRVGPALLAREAEARERAVRDLVKGTVYDEMLADISARGQVETALGVTAMAVRRYAADRGRLPEDLTALVPAYLGEVPMDAYARGAVPLGYRVDEAGRAIVYSVGKDGRDDGGAVAEGGRRRWEAADHGVVVGGIGDGAR